jgi:phosphohistidine swiveling domain-containing protein
MSFKKDSRIWIKNFSIDRCSYQVIIPVYKTGFFEAQKTLFPKQPPFFLNEYFAILKGKRLEGSFFLKEELKTFIQKTLTTILEKPEKIKKIHRETYVINDQYFKYAQTLQNLDFSKLSNQELKKVFEKLTILQEKSHQHALCTTWFIDSFNETFSKFLIQRVQEIIEKKNLTLNVAAVFSLLTTLPKNGLIIKEEIESLKILQKISKNKKTKNIFLNLKDFSKIPDDIDPKIHKIIKKHFYKWSWIPFEYLGPAYSIDHFLKHWHSLLKTRIKISQELKKLLAKPLKIKKERTKLYKKLNLNAENKNLFEIAADIIFLKGYRKDRCFFGFYVNNFILKEIAKRFNLSMEEVNLLTYEEIFDLLKKKRRISLRTINQRKGTTVIWGNSKKMGILTGEKANAFIQSKNIETDKIVSSSKELKGICASSGKAMGRVKIINSVQEIEKMNQGDILVAHTTFPSLVPAMKKAAAIVTEDGGITCHAAIVSRELNLPCVTGVKNATKTLKDNDKIEVLADQGLVKII